MSFTDHKNMISYPLNNFSDGKIDAEIIRYTEERDRISPKYYDYRNNLNILQSNIDIFNEIKRERYLKKLEDNFVLNRYHLEVLKSAYLKSNDKGNYLRYYADFELFCKNKGFDKADISENKESELYDEFQIILEELPFAVAFLAKRYCL